MSCLATCGWPERQPWLMPSGYRAPAPGHREGRASYRNAGGSSSKVARRICDASGSEALAAQSTCIATTARAALIIRLVARHCFGEVDAQFQAAFYDLS